MFSAASFDVSDVAIAPARKKDRRGQARHLSEGELATFFNHCPDPKWQAVFALAYFTGSRISEVLSLTADAVQRDRIIITILKSKKGSTREIKMLPMLRTILAEYGLPGEGYLFPAYQNSKRKTHLSRQAADKVMRQVIEAAGGVLEGVSTHSFRRSFATNLKRAGKTDAEIQRLLGHASATMTSRYMG